MVSTLFKTALSIDFFSSISAVTKIILLATFRKARLITHAQMKFGLQKEWQKMSSLGHRETLKRYSLCYIETEIRIDLRTWLLEKKQQGAVIRLATAAPYDYVLHFHEKMPFLDYILCTPLCTDENWFHNIGQKKRDNVLEFLKQKKISLRQNLLLLTDHLDDLPLIEIADTTLSFPPLSQQTKLLPTNLRKKIRKFYGS